MNRTNASILAGAAGQVIQCRLKEPVGVDDRFDMLTTEAEAGVYYSPAAVLRAQFEAAGMLVSDAVAQAVVDNHPESELVRNAERVAAGGPHALEAVALNVRVAEARMEPPPIELAWADGRPLRPLEAAHWLRGGGPRPVEAAVEFLEAMAVLRCAEALAEAGAGGPTGVVDVEGKAANDAPCIKPPPSRSSAS